MELLEKLAVLLPPPGRHLVTYHGVLSSAAQWRDLIIPDGQGDAAPTKVAPEEPPEPVVPPPPPVTPAMRARHIAWAALMQRTFGSDALKSEKCGGRMKLGAVALGPYEVARLCQNLGEPTEGPRVAPSRFVVQTE